MNRSGFQGGGEPSGLKKNCENANDPEKRINTNIVKGREHG